MKIPTGQPDQSGYTIIEVLVALAILMIVLVPATELISYLLTSRHTLDRFNAAQLAEREMELVSLFIDDQGRSIVESIGSRSYTIIREVERADFLTKINIRVLLAGTEDPLVELYRYRKNEAR